MARIIGRNGANINTVREATGATIEIEKLVRKDDDRMVNVRGTSEAVQNAVNIIQLLISDAEILINDAVRTVLRGNSSVASSVSSEGTSKSAVDSIPYTPVTIPSGVSNATSKRQSSPAPQQLNHQQPIHYAQSQKYSKHHHGHNQHSKEQSGGGNVWQQRMAARQEVEKPPPLMQQQPHLAQPAQRTLHQQSVVHQPQPTVNQQPQPIPVVEAVRQIPAPLMHVAAQVPEVVKSSEN